MRNKEKQKVAQHTSYLRNKEEIKSRSSIRRSNRKVWYRDFMQNFSCKFCSESSIECLDWHHLDPSTKRDTVSTLLNEYRSMQSVLDEMEKCIVVCSNCHRKIHANKISTEGISAETISQSDRARTYNF